MTQPAPPMISVLRDNHCIGFLRSAGPRGFTAYDAGQLIGLFHDKQAAIEAITAPTTGD
jgi:hypothetical protein